MLRKIIRILQYVKTNLQVTFFAALLAAEILCRNLCAW